ncbi:MAG: hypothetical protein ACPHL9_11720, partial [Limisphaerales bacterium]
MAKFGLRWQAKRDTAFGGSGFCGSQFLVSTKPTAAYRALNFESSVATPLCRSTPKRDYSIAIKSISTRVPWEAIELQPLNGRAD